MHLDEPLLVEVAIRDLVDRCRQNLATGLQAAGSRAPDPRFPADSESADRVLTCAGSGDGRGMDAAGQAPDRLSGR